MAKKRNLGYPTFPRLLVPLSPEAFVRYLNEGRMYISEEPNEKCRRRLCAYMDELIDTGRGHNPEQGQKPTTSHTRTKNAVTSHGAIKKLNTAANRSTILTGNSGSDFLIAFRSVPGLPLPQNLQNASPYSISLPQALQNIESDAITPANPATKGSGETPVVLTSATAWPASEKQALLTSAL
jgi:hypothetical protein